MVNDPWLYQVKPVFSGADEKLHTCNLEEYGA